MTTTAAVLLLTWALETWWGGKSSIILAWHDREMTISYEMMMGSLVVVVKAGKGGGVCYIVYTVQYTG